MAFPQRTAPPELSKGIASRLPSARRKRRPEAFSSTRHRMGSTLKPPPALALCLYAPKYTLQAWAPFSMSAAASPLRSTSCRDGTGSGMSAEILISRRGEAKSVFPSPFICSWKT